MPRGLQYNPVVMISDNVDLEWSKLQGRPRSKETRGNRTSVFSVIWNGIYVYVKYLKSLLLIVMKFMIVIWSMKTLDIVHTFNVYSLRLNDIEVAERKHRLYMYTKAFIK